MQYFTLSLAASHSEGKQNTLTSQSVSGIDVSSTALLRDSRSRSTSFSVAATKNIPSLFAKLGADGSYSFGSGEQAISSSMGGEVRRGPPSSTPARTATPYMATPPSPPSPDSNCGTTSFMGGRRRRPSLRAMGAVRLRAGTQRKVYLLPSPVGEGLGVRL